MKYHVTASCSTHKIITRFRYLRSCNPVVAEKLKEILEEHKAKEKRK